MAGAIAILVAILLFLVIAIAGAHRKPPEELPRRSNSRREPDFDNDDFELGDFDRDYGPRADTGPRRRERRSGRFGFGAVMVSFLLGLMIGLGGLVAAPHVRVGSLVTALLGLVQAGPSTAREQASEAGPAEEPAAAPGAKPAPPRQRMREAKAHPQPAEGKKVAVAAPVPEEPVPATVPPISDDRDARLTSFVDRLKAEVPKPVGPTTVLASVERKKETVTLGYSLTSVPTDAEVQQIQDALKTGVIDTFCHGKSEEARFLNDNGIEFRLIYTDKDGRTIARLTAEPRFCDKAG
ncbi:MAG: hypothetical protein ABI399_05530 [Bauldia sp.]